MIFYWIAIFKYDFLYIVPLAIKRVVDNISDAFVVIDKYDMIIEYNKAFSEIFLKGQHYTKNTYFSDMIKTSNEFGAELEKLKGFINKSISEETVINFEMYFCSIDKHFLIEINTIISDSNYMGTVILLKNITEYKKLFEKMKTQNEELTVLNEQLTNYAVTIKELTLEKERSRIETEIHNLMGHNLNVLLRLIEVCKVTFTDDPEKALSSVLNAEAIIKSTMNNVRKIAQEIGSSGQPDLSQGQSDNSLSFLEILLNNFQKNTGVNVVHSFEGDFSDVDRSLIRVIYSICQEAATNSLKHGKAKMVTVLLRCQQNNVLLSILDDGVGCNDIKELGLGLKGMQEMVKDLNGSIEFKSDENDGFKISVMLPLKESEKC
jgi:signal transduction histidine kinase